MLDNLVPSDFGSFKHGVGFWQKEVTLNRCGRRIRWKNPRTRSIFDFNSLKRSFQIFPNPLIPNHNDISCSFRYTHFHHKESKGRSKWQYAKISTIIPVGPNGDWIEERDYTSTRSTVQCVVQVLDSMFTNFRSTQFMAIRMIGIWGSYSVPHRVAASLIWGCCLRICCLSMIDGNRIEIEIRNLQKGGDGERREWIWTTFVSGHCQFSRSEFGGKRGDPKDDGIWEIATYRRGSGLDDVGWSRNSIKETIKRLISEELQFECVWWWRIWPIWCHTV